LKIDIGVENSISKLKPLSKPLICRKQFKGFTDTLMQKFLLLFIGIVAQSVFAFGQKIKNEEVQWEQIFRKDTGKSTENSVSSKSKNYLLKLDLRNYNFLSTEEDFHVQRQLDNETYIVKLSDFTIEKYRNLFNSIIEVNNKWKLSPGLLRDSFFQEAMKSSAFNVLLSDFSSFDTLVLHHADQITIEHKYEQLKIVRVQCSYAFVLSYLINADEVSYVEKADRPVHSESPIIGFDNSVNMINLVHAEWPQINGEGLTVSIKEDKYDNQDIDLTGRDIPTNISSNIISQHATEMATLIGGAANSFFSGGGAVSNVGLSSADDSNLMPDQDAYQQYHISVQNHSYGVDIENFYGADAAAYDNSMITYPDLVHVFSSGNSGDQTSQDGLYAGLPNVSNLTGSFKMAKNIITVGSIDVLGAVQSLSSKGPAYDGRIKPELVAYGESGSSEAAAITSGALLLLQNSFSQIHNGQLPENALVKAILINSAKDVGAPGIDFSAGYGSVDAFRAVQNMIGQKYFMDSLGQNQYKTFTISVPDSARNLKITLVWDDPPAIPNAYKSLVNDLDLTLINNSSGQSWLPWVLNSSPSLDSLQLPPHRGRDSLNVVEQISLDIPSPGQYTIQVAGTKITGTDQSFYISYQWDTLNHFKWTYPTPQDFMGREGSNTFRWESSYDSYQRGKLEFSLDKGNTWILIDSLVNISQQYYPWTPIDTFAIALVRMTIDGRSYVSDSFSFSSPIKLQVGFDCADSLMLYWNKVNGIIQYRVYSIVDNHLTPSKYTIDTSVILSKATGYPYYAVSSVFADGTEGVKSYTINIPDQGIGCYISNFSGFLQGDSAIGLELDLATIYDIQHIYFEKLTLNGWSIIQDDSVFNVLSVTGTDRSPVVGANIYRAQITFANGSTITSDIETVYYFGINNIIVAPNPVPKSQSFRVISKIVYGFTLSITDLTGRILFQKKSPSQIEIISSSNLQSGIYIITLRGNDGEIYSSRFVVI
jgi:Subtilase family/Secretion system C-terminal sorting domain